MKIKELNADKYMGRSKGLDARIETFQRVIQAINDKEIEDSVALRINAEIDSLNYSTMDEKSFKKQLPKVQMKILNILKKELKLVPLNYYRNQWLAVGMSALGLPIGVLYAIAIDNMAMLAIGIPIGMVIGMGVGAGMDKKAKKEGKQLNVQFDL